MSGGYAQPKMPAPATGRGPWGAAIRYWLPRKKMRQADLVRATGLGKNTVSSATLGLDVNTATLAAIARAFEEPIEVVLVSPEWMDRQDSQRQVIQEAVERALRNVTPSTRLSTDQAIDNLETAITEEEARRAAHPKKLARPVADKKKQRSRP